MKCYPGWLLMMLALYLAFLTGFGSRAYDPDAAHRDGIYDKGRPQIEMGIFVDDGAPISVPKVRRLER